MMETYDFVFMVFLQREVPKTIKNEYKLWYMRITMGPILSPPQLLLKLANLSFWQTFLDELCYTLGYELAKFQVSMTTRSANAFQ